MANKPDIELSIGISKASAKAAEKELGGLYKKLAAQKKNDNSLTNKTSQDLLKQANVQRNIMNQNKADLGLMKQKTNELTKQQKIAKGIAGGLGRTARGIGGLVRVGAGLAASAGSGIMGFLMGAAQSGYQLHTQNVQAQSGMIGLGSGSAVKRAQGRAGRGARYGYSVIDVAKMSPMMARATGNIDPLEMMQANRATGMSLGEVGGTFGAMRQSGHTFDKPGKKGGGGAQFAKLKILSALTGLEGPRLKEFLDGVQGLAGMAGSNTRENISWSKSAYTQTKFGLYGKEHGLEGLKGARGAEFANRVTANVMAPGGGEAGQALVQQAMGFGKPGGNTSYYNALKRQQSAAQDPTVVRDVVGETTKQYGKGQEGAMAISNLLKVSLKDSETLIKIYDSSASSEEKEEQIKKVMDANQSLEKQSLDAMRGSSATLTHMAKMTNMGVNFGAKIAKAVEAIQSWIALLLPKLVNFIEKEVIPVLKDIYDFFVNSREGEAKTAFDAYSKTRYSPEDQSLSLEERLRIRAQKRKEASRQSEKELSIYHKLETEYDKAGNMGKVGIAFREGLKSAANSVANIFRSDKNQSVGNEERFARALEIKKQIAEGEQHPAVTELLERGNDALGKKGGEELRRNFASVGNNPQIIAFAKRALSEPMDKQREAIVLLDNLYKATEQAREEAKAANEKLTYTLKEAVKNMPNAGGRGIVPGH